MTSMDEILKYSPPGPVAAAFIRDKEPLVKALLGPVGSGKSTAACVSIVTDSAEQQASPIDGRRRSRVAVVRNTYIMLQTTTIRTWHDWVPKTAGRWKAEGPPTHFLEFRLPDQSIVDLGANGFQLSGDKLNVEFSIDLSIGRKL